MLDPQFEQILQDRILIADGDEDRVLGHRHPVCPLGFLFRCDLTRDHADIHGAGQGVGHALAGAARRDIESDVRVQLLEFFRPARHHRVERKGA